MRQFTYSLIIGDKIYAKIPIININLEDPLNNTFSSERYVGCVYRGDRVSIFLLKVGGL